MKPGQGRGGAASPAEVCGLSPREGSAISAHQVTLIPGDGTGPEICTAARRCIDATGAPIRWEVQHAGQAAMEESGSPLPDATLASLRRNRVALKGPTASGAVSSAIRSVNLHLRTELDLFACIRPCKRYAGVRSFYSDVPIDLTIVRENTEDLYYGLEFEAGTKENAALVDLIERGGKHRLPPNCGLSVKPISKEASRRILTFGFDYARRMKRRKVTVVHKANLMKATDGLFLQTAKEVAREFPGIEFEDKLVDSTCMQLVTQPQQFDVIVTTNLYGDILSDLAAGLVGGLSVAPGGNVGDKVAIFEAMHGSGARHRGQDRVNPTAIILAGVLMLRHLGEMDAADLLDRAVASVLREGKYVTYDLKPQRHDASAVTTSRMVDAIIERMRRG